MLGVFVDVFFVGFVGSILVEAFLSKKKQLGCFVFKKTKQQPLSFRNVKGSNDPQLN